MAYTFLVYLFIYLFYFSKCYWKRVTPKGMCSSYPLQYIRWQYSSLPKVSFYLYQAIVPPIIQRFPRALFPVSLRDNTRGALIAFLSLRAFYSSRTRRPLETILSRGSHRSLFSLIAFVPLRSFFASLPWPGGPMGPFFPGAPRYPCSPLAPSLPLRPGTPGTPGTPQHMWLGCCVFKAIYIHTIKSITIYWVSGGPFGVRSLIGRYKLDFWPFLFDRVTLANMSRGVIITLFQIVTHLASF